MSDDGSMEFSEDYEDIKAQPLGNIKIPQRMFQKINPNPSLFVNANINVLSTNKINSKFVINQQFQQYLMEDINNSNAVIVSFLGKKKVGKSFLVDTLITAETGRVSRSMSKNSSALINSHPYRLTKGSQNNLIFFDCNGEVSHQIFLWTFFMSSVLVYNIQARQNYNDEFHKLKQLLSYVQVHFDTDGEDISLPQLIIVIRDSKFKQVDKSLISQLEHFGMFQLPIRVFDMSYPGSKDVSSKEILDVPLKKLNSSYIDQSVQLLKLLKLGKEKIIKGNYLSSKILSLAIEGATKNFNKDGKISSTKVWNQVMQNLSIGFYNYYLQCYEQELGLQFQTEKPWNKYTIYKKLSGIRRKLDKKIENFKNLNEDPIFQKYKNRLNQVIKSKEKLIKQVNKQKSSEANQKYCSILFPDLNNQNCQLLMARYMESELDDEKSTVLLQNFENILEHRSRTQPKKQTGKQNSLQQQIKTLQIYNQDLNNRLNQKQKLGAAPDLAGKNSIILKKKQQLKKMTNRYNQQHKKAQASNQQLNTQFQKLKQQKQRINQQIQKNETKLIQLRQQRQQEMRKTTKQFQKQYQTQQEKLRILEQRLRQAKKVKVVAVSPPPPAKDKGCCCVLM